LPVSRLRSELVVGTSVVVAFASQSTHTGGNRTE